LYSRRKSIIHDDVWLVGSCTVGSGLTLGKRSICMAHSVITKDTEPNCTYMGSPAIKKEQMNFWKPLDLTTKFKMMHAWIIEYQKENQDVSFEIDSEFDITIYNSTLNQRLVFTNQIKNLKDQTITEFDMLKKEFYKKNTEFERKFYKYIYNNKARFVPISIL
jgi:hypothetical protein